MWSGTKPSITEATTGLLYQTRIMMDDDECEALSGMLGRGNGSVRRKPVNFLVHIFSTLISYSMKSNRDGGNNQNLTLFIRGNAMSLQ
jgi:hypothetical protein